MVEAVSMNSFAVVSGTHIVLQFSVVDDDGNAVSLSGGSGRFAMARKASSSSTLAVDTAASPQTATLTVTDAGNGLLEVAITDEVTDTLSGDYYYELQWTDSTGRSMPTARGYISFEDNLL